MVPVVGLEPTRISPHDFESRSSASSDTPAQITHYTPCAAHFQERISSAGTRVSRSGSSGPKVAAAARQPSASA